MQINYVGVSFGADPEFFFKQGGEIVGAEKIIPKEGVKHPLLPSRTPTTIIDGVQAEFNPASNTCRESFSGNLRQCFVELQANLQGKNVELDFSAGVKITKEELESLVKENQVFGCTPSANVYGESHIQVQDASKYYYRSAGGHIHLGTYNSHSMILKSNPTAVVQMLDILLGNTCVLLDRDPGNIERRKNYGRAGEYRLPAHGLEYRTLSNFWLRHYVLMSFVMGVARFAVAVAASPEAYNLVLEHVDLKDIERAINDNDFDLAYQNFNKLKDLLADFSVEGEDTTQYPSQLPFGGTRVAAFEKLVDKGVKHYFKQEPMVYWLGHTTGNGWERFADSLKTKTPAKKLAQGSYEPVAATF